MASCKVSIIVNTYNGEKYVDKIIRVLKPYYNFDDYEFILVDDGSQPEDNTAIRFKNSFPKAQIIVQDNSGLAAARNKGASVASGQYLQFIDIDDAISAEKITSQYNYAVKHNADVVYSDWRMMIVDTEENEHPEEWVKSQGHNNILESLITGWWNPFHSYLIKKEVYNSVNGSNPKLVNAQDFDLMVRIAAKGFRFEYVEGNFSEYYRYENVKSLARGNRTQYWKDNEYTVDNVLKIIKENSGKLDDPIVKAACNRLFYIARNVYKIDRTWNRDIMNKISELSHNFVPDNQSRSFMWLYHLLGYYNTERLLFVIKK